jgi:hypothetical protein
LNPYTVIIAHLAVETKKTPSPMPSSSQLSTFALSEDDSCQLNRRTTEPTFMANVEARFPVDAW